MTADVLRQVAERLVSNSWDTYIAEKAGDRNWMEIADTILADGRALAREYLARNPADTSLEAPCPDPSPP